MEKQTTRQTARARDRLLNAAYDLFATQGIARVGVDRVVSESGCAKSSLYNNFGSKEELALAFLDRREELWTRNWLENEVRQRETEPKARLLAIFDVFDGWFQRPDFEGCAFVNVLLESDSESPVRRAAAQQLAKIRAFVRDFAEEAGLADSATFAQVWHMLMKGSIVAAGEGNREAARQARQAGQMILDGWPKAA